MDHGTELYLNDPDGKPGHHKVDLGMTLITLKVPGCPTQLLIKHVTPCSLADSLGFRANDEVIVLDDHLVFDVDTEQLMHITRSLQVNRDIFVVIRRDSRDAILIGRGESDKTPTVEVGDAFSALTTKISVSRTDGTYHPSASATTLSAGQVVFLRRDAHEDSHVKIYLKVADDKYLKLASNGMLAPSIGLYVADTAFVIEMLVFKCFRVPQPPDTLPRALMAIMLRSNPNTTALRGVAPADDQRNPSHGRSQSEGHTVNGRSQSDNDGVNGRSQSDKEGVSGRSQSDSDRVDGRSQSDDDGDSGRSQSDNDGDSGRSQSDSDGVNGRSQSDSDKVNGRSQSDKEGVSGRSQSDSDEVGGRSQSDSDKVGGRSQPVRGGMRATEGPERQRRRPLKPITINPRMLSPLPKWSHDGGNTSLDLSMGLNLKVTLDDADADADADEDSQVTSAKYLMYRDGKLSMEPIADDPPEGATTMVKEAGFFIQKISYSWAFQPVLQQGEYLAVDYDVEKLVMKRILSHDDLQNDPSVRFSSIPVNPTGASSHVTPQPTLAPGAGSARHDGNPGVYTLDAMNAWSPFELNDKFGKVFRNIGNINDFLSEV